MYDLTKPDLIIHPKFYPSVVNYNLQSFYNVVPIESLTIIPNIQPILVTENDCYSLKDVTLTKFFNNYIGSGIKPQYTTYTFGEKTPIYSIEENGPRYVIWPCDEPLTICATYLDRIQACDLYQALQRAKAWAFNITQLKSIVVFDLDETLISSTGEPLNYSYRVLERARSIYDIMVLYSHGSNLHVDEHLVKFQNAYTDNNRPLFDLILSKSQNDHRSSKNLLYIYNFFPNIRFKRAVLIDDSLYNWTPEYNNIIVPSTRSLVHMTKVLCQPM